MADGVPSQGDPNQRQAGQTLGQVVRALAANGGDLYRAQHWAQQMYPHDDHIQRALSGSITTAGGVFVQPEVFNEVVGLLRNREVIMSFNPIEITMPTGVASIPRVTEGSVATYVGENQGNVATDMAFDDIVLVWKKLRSMVSLSSDLLRFANPSADVIVRDDMVRALAVGMDQAFLRGTGTAHTPKGLRHWALPENVLTASPLPGTVDGNIAAITDDFNRIWLALLNNNIPMTNPGWIMAPRTATYLSTFRSTLGALVWGEEMTRGTILGMPFRTTNSVPINLGVTGSEIYLTDFADAVVGTSMNLVIDVSTEATYQQGGELRSAWDRDQTVVRAIQEHDFAMRRDESVAILDGVQWGA